MEAICHAIDISDSAVLESFQKKYQFDCVVIGPEAALAQGLSDTLRGLGVAVFGPSQAAARLETSKVFAKEFMMSAGVPTAPFEIVESVEDCLNAAKKFQPPFVLKADGLAAGKGVFICDGMADLQKAANQLFVEQSFGAAGARALLEEYQPGYELSYLVVTDGHGFQPLPLAQDHKRLLNGDQGPNTGGMGVVGPVQLDESLLRQIHDEIVSPTIQRIEGSGLMFRGVLYFGLMMTAQGPRLLEYNVRFGDPEAQIILPLLDGDWGQVFLQLAQGELPVLHWKNLFMACVVMAAPGYPERPQKGVPMEGDLRYQTASSYFLHAGSGYQESRWVTNGGRVLNAIGIGSDLPEALKNAYAQAEKVGWPGLQMRTDIGAKILTN